MENDGTRQTPTSKALAMLSAFASVGARAFNKTILDIDGNEVKGLYRGGRSLEDLRRTIGRDLQDAERNRHSVVIRPLFKTPLLVQLDDLDRATIERITPLAFMTIRTSAGADGNGNYQAWVAVNDAPADTEAAKDFIRRLKKANDADDTASGSTRIAGSLNFKTKYAPDFPRVQITHTNPGHMTSMAALEEAGFVAPPQQPRPPRPALSSRSTDHAPKKGAGWKRWPSYQMCLAGAPESKSRPGNPRRSLADFTWCRTAIEWGWSVEATAGHLMEVSTKAQENGEAYAMQTARRAAESVERNPYRERWTPRPA
jgi:hypothetical protein